MLIGFTIAGWILKDYQKAPSPGVSTRGLPKKQVSGWRAFRGQIDHFQSRFLLRPTTPFSVRSLAALQGGAGASPGRKGEWSRSSDLDLHVASAVPIPKRSPPVSAAANRQAEESWAASRPGSGLQGAHNID